MSNLERDSNSASNSSDEKFPSRARRPPAFTIKNTDNCSLESHQDTVCVPSDVIVIDCDGLDDVMTALPNDVTCIEIDDNALDDVTNTTTTTTPPPQPIATEFSKKLRKEGIHLNCGGYESQKYPARTPAGGTTTLAISGTKCKPPLGRLRYVNSYLDYEKKEQITKKDTTKNPNHDKSLEGLERLLDLLLPPPVILLPSDPSVPALFSSNVCLTSDISTLAATLSEDSDNQKMKPHPRGRFRGIKMYPRFSFVVPKKARNRLQVTTNSNRASSFDFLDEDSNLATSLREEEEHAAQHEKEKEHFKMFSTNCGRAFLFVEKVLEVVDKLVLENGASSALAGISAVSKDDMVFLAERMFDKQDEFRKANKPVTIDIGYHYTTTLSLGRIKTDGLLTKSERATSNIGAKNHGSVYGDGVYTGNNPFAFRQFGPVGLLVARLKGVVRLAATKQDLLPDGSFDTIIGNKKKNHEGNTVALQRAKHLDYFDEVVMQSSSQCIPLVKYSEKRIPSRVGPASGLFVRHGGPDTETPIRAFRIALEKVVNEFFNCKAAPLEECEKAIISPTSVPDFPEVRRM
jgi:hypothetical protein